MTTFKQWCEFNVVIKQIDLQSFKILLLSGYVHMYTVQLLYLIFIQIQKSRLPFQQFLSLTVYMVVAWY